MKANYRSWVQLLIAVIATLFGLTLVGLALFLPPRGVIDPNRTDRLWRDPHLRRSAHRY